MSIAISETTSRPKRRRAYIIGGFSPKILTLIVAVLVWHAASVLNESWPFYNATLVPSPMGIWHAAVGLYEDGTLLTHVSASTLRVFEGMALAIPLGVALAFLVASNRFAEIAIDPIVELIRPVPSLALLPVFIVWFGIGELTKIIFIAYSAFFIIYLTTLEAIRDIDPILKQAAGTLGLNRWRTMRHVTLKAVFPSIMVGIRLALAISWFIIVGAEFLAANEGLGYLINFSRVWFQINAMMVGAVLIGLLGLATNYLLLALERRLFAWRDR